MIPDGLQGRVNSGFRLICFSMNPVGAALCGLTLEWWGTTATVAVFSAFYLALTVATWMDDVVRKAPRHAPAPVVEVK